MSRSPVGARRALALAAALAAAVGAKAAAADSVASSAISTAPARTPLQLAVWINGADTGLIAAFAMRPDGALLVRPVELRSLGLRAPETLGPGEIVLGTLPGVKARYDARQQRLDITATDAALLPTTLRGRISGGPVPSGPAPSDFGAVMNYSLVTGASDSGRHMPWSSSGIGGEFESRLFGAFGLVDNDVTVQVTGRTTNLERLDTTWSWSDPNALTTYRAGDLIGGGFVWTRPVRFGGFQFERDFSLRPDLITMPSPRLSASAAVPSMADVLVNGLAVDSEAVRRGPLQIQDLPVAEGANQTDVVLRDTLGRQMIISSGFFVTPDLLKPGLTDFSVEGGFARRDYGLRSFDYDEDPAISASVRTGLTDWATTEGHLEADPHIIEGGAAAALRMGGLGVASVSAAASDYHDRAGAQLGATLRAQAGPIAVSGLVQQTVGTYLDLGAVTGPPGVAPAQLAPPRRLVQVGVSAPLEALAGGAHLGPVGTGPYLALSVSSATPVVGATRTVASADLRQTFKTGVAIFANAYVDNRPRGAEGGGYIGVSMPFGSGGMADAGVRSESGVTSAFVEASEQGGLQPGSLNWRMRAEGGETNDLEGDVAYRFGFGVVEANAQRLNGATQAQATFDGALVAMDGQLFASNRIDGAFAVVDTGLPHVPVTFENRPVGDSGPRGRILVPYLNAYQRNVIGIDGDALPADVVAATTRRVVAPARGAGMVVRFALRPALQGAVIALLDATGAPLPVGAQGRIKGTGGVFVVGYDGLAYLEAVSSGAAVEVSLADGRSCSANIVETGRAKQPVRCL